MANTMSFKSIFITYVASLIIIISLISISKCDASSSKSGFTVDLIHREYSPRSPSYDPSLSPYQRLANAVQRSFDRARRFDAKRIDSKQTDPRPEIVNARGEYLIQYSIGTPPVLSLGIFDTGSDLLWTQCKPCLKCFTQKLPIFTPNASSTYRRIPCNNPKCTSLKETFCSKSGKKNCLYGENYADGSSTNGELALDTLTLASSTKGKTVTSPNIKFGCGFSNSMPFTAGESGIVGLGGGPSSLARQLPYARGRFAYCLVSLSDNRSNSSKLSFGARARVSGRGVVSTPMVRKDPETFYYLTMEGITIGNQRLRFDDKNPRARPEGNIIIDSGTTLTLLPFGLYDRIVTALKSSINLKEIEDPQGVLELCYYSKDDAIKMPRVTVHFRGANVDLKQDNVFVRTSETSVCLAARPVEGEAIYGNLWQVNFLVWYDLSKRTVSFKAADCGRP
ncbi:hypothetical protein ABFX02_02G131700 [Erythranthe guttata]